MDGKTVIQFTNYRLKPGKDLDFHLFRKYMNYVFPYQFYGSVFVFLLHKPIFDAAGYNYFLSLTGRSKCVKKVGCFQSDGNIEFHSPYNMHHNLLLADDDIDDCTFFEDALDELPISTTLLTVNDGVQLMKYSVR
jgi:hypothetical protein